MNPEEANFRKFGPPPHTLVLVHGGPGAAGSLGALARELSRTTGVIDAYQTGYNIPSLLEELHAIITRHASTPVVLLGHSWGAWLSLLFAGRHSPLVRKLILVASAPLEDKYVPGILETRMNRLDKKEREKFTELARRLELPETDDRDQLFLELACILRKADAFDAAQNPAEDVMMDYERYMSVWKEAERMRSSGDLIRLAGEMTCPALAIHGDYDPHPFAGVSDPLSRTLQDFNFILLPKCGHYPWLERHAKDRFYHILKKEIGV